MIQENKELLLRDLCARLPYGVEVEYNSIKCEVLSIDKYNEELTIRVCPDYCPIVKLENIKPYLFPLSSMTDEQKNELEDTLSKLSLKLLFDEISSEIAESCVIDFYNKKHIDYRGLIPKGLAIDATGLNIY